MTISAELIEHFHLLGDAPETVQQLRKIIVALAIGGKLANEGKPAIDATSLRDEIQKRRHALTVGGQLRRKEHPEVAAEDLPADFLDTSRFVRLGFVANVEKGVTGIQSAKQGPYPLVVTAADRATCDHFDFEGAAAIVPLVSSAGHGKASLNRLHYQEGKFALGSILAAVFPLAPDLISARFLFEYLTAFKEELLVSRMSGTANVTLTVGRLCDVPVPLIAPATQKRIDELMELCDQLEAARNEREARRDRLVAASLHRIGTAAPAADEAATETQSTTALRDAARFHLDHLPRLTSRVEHIKQLRQTILSLAVHGHLVPQDLNDEPAAELLKRIRVEQARLENDQSQKKSAALPDIDLEQAPFDLPTGWSWARFPELGTFGRGKSKHRPRNDAMLFEGGTHPLIQTGDVARSQGVIRTFTNKYNDTGLAQSMKWPAGTLCITIAANIADSGILSFDACFPDSVVGFIPASVFKNARYFEYFVRTAKANLLEFAPATAQKNINLEILNAVLIPIPPLAEQYRIVDKVDELMALCDQLEAQLTATQTDSRRLLDAVLHEALAAAA